MKFQWQQQYAIGDALIDQEHQHLFDLANQITGDLSRDELIHRIILLYRHTREHFSNEEKLMRKHAYPDYERHVADHDHMLATLVAQSDELNKGNVTDAQVMTFMENWTAHILCGDRQFRDYLQAEQSDATRATDPASPKP